MRNLALLTAVILMGFTACKKDDPMLFVLSDQEKADITFLIQEEKLARDVYVFAYEKYGAMVFNNISSSEQSHMDKVENLLLRYTLPNPIDGLAIGAFEDQTLQLLYNDLIAKADSSLIYALKVGATIEDLDIHDIETLYGHTSNADLIDVYAVLTCGSRNHMRSFVSTLESLGETYSPQFISVSDFDAIVNSAKENCGN